MKRTNPTTLALILFCMVVSGARTGRAEQPYELNVVLAMTGNAAFVGQGEQKNLQRLQALVNKTGGIGGRPLQFTFHDSQTTPQLAVQIANRLISAHPAIILGPSIVGECNAVAPLLRDGPVMYCFAPGIHPPPGSYMFSSGISTLDLMSVVVRFAKLQGWTRLAVISSIDATGQDVDRGIAEVLGRSENQAFTVVEHAHFNPADLSVAAQVQRIKAAQPQTVIAWTTGAGIATIFRGLQQAGVDVPVFTTNGNQTNAQLAQYRDFLPKQLYFPSSTFPKHEGVGKLEVRVEGQQEAMYGVLREASELPDEQTVAVWDPALIVVAALRKLGPDASAQTIRDFIEGLDGFPGIDGLYDFKKFTQRGVGEQDAVVVRWDPQQGLWRWVSGPGGAPLN